MPDSALSSTSTTLARVPLFWQLQLAGWGGFMLLTLPLKQAVYGSMSAGLCITAYQLPLSLALSGLLRQFYRQTQLTQRNHWLAARLVLAGGATAGAGDALVSITFSAYSVQQTSLGRGFMPSASPST